MHAIADPSDAVNISVFDSGYEPGLETLDTYWWEKICSWANADELAPAPVKRRSSAELVKLTVSFSIEDAVLLDAEEFAATDPELNPYWAFAYIENIATRQSPRP